MQHLSDQFVALPYRLLEVASAYEVAVYAALARRVDNTTRRCWPSHSTIANDAGVSLATAKRCLKGLRGHGYVTWSGTVRADGSRGSNVYTVFAVATFPAGRTPPQTADDVVPEDDYPDDPPLPESHPQVSESEGGSSHRPNKNLDPNIELQNPPIPPQRPTAALATVEAIPSQFDKFWTAYPRRVGKGAARRAWEAAVKAGVDPDDIIAGAERFRADPNRSPDARYTPHPSTWIRGERWLDEAVVELPPQPERADIFEAAKRRMADAQPGGQRAIVNLRPLTAGEGSQ